MSTKFARRWTAEETADVVARHLAGESHASIGRAHGRSHTTVARLLAAPDIAAVIEEQRSAAQAEERVERERKSARERQARHREKKTREEMGVAPSGNPHERPVRGGADGRVLGVFGLPRPSNPSAPTLTYYSRHERDATISREQWLDLPREPVYEPAVLVTPIGSYTFDPEDRGDLARIASIAADDLPGISENDLRATLSTIERGRRVRIVPEDEPEDVQVVAG